MERKNMIDLLCKARNLLHKYEKGEELTSNDIVMAHDFVDMVLDALVDQDFREKRVFTKEVSSEFFMS